MISDLVSGLTSVLLTLAFSPTGRIWTSRKGAPLLLLWAGVLGLDNTLAGHSWPFQPQSTYSAESMATGLWGCADQDRVVLGTGTARRSPLAPLNLLPVVLSSLQNLAEKFEMTGVAQGAVGVSCKVGEGSRAALGRRWPLVDMEAAPQ